MSFFTLLNHIFSNIISVFKHFFHWTLARILIVIFVFFLAVGSFIPFFIVLVILGIIDPISWGEIFTTEGNGAQVIGLISGFSTAPLFFILEVLIAVLGIAFAIGVYHYKVILLYRLISSYISEESLKIRNIFTLQYLKKYIQAFLKIIKYLLIPVAIYVVFCTLIVVLFGGLENILTTVQNSAINLVSIILGIGLLMCIGVFIYIYYRFIFIYPHLEKHPDQSVDEIFQASKDITKGCIIFFVLGTIILYALISSPSASYEKYLEIESQELETYYSMRVLEGIPKNDSFADYGIFEYSSYEDVTLDPNFITLDQKYNLETLEDIELKKANKDLFSNLLFVFNFIVFYGMFEIFVYSLYMYFKKQEKIVVKSHFQKFRGIFGKKKSEL